MSFPFIGSCPHMLETDCPECSGVPLQSSLDAYIAHLKRRQTASFQLSLAVESALKSSGVVKAGDARAIAGALHTLIAGDIDDRIASAQMPYPKAPKFTIEDLDRAARERDQARNSMDALERMVSEMPEATAEFMRNSQTPMLQHLLDAAEQRLTFIQEEMERPDEPEQSQSEGEQS